MKIESYVKPVKKFSQKHSPNADLTPLRLGVTSSFITPAVTLSNIDSLLGQAGKNLKVRSKN